MKILRFLFIVLLFLTTAFAQGRDPIAGAWEGIGGKNLTTGAAIQPLTPALHVIYSNGQYVQFAAGANRPKVDTPVANLSEKDLRERYRGVQGQYGTYVVQGNKLTRKTVSAAAPINEGREIPNEFKIEGDTLIITNKNAQGETVENRFKRLPSGT
jgi:hypothetical protein